MTFFRGHSERFALIFYAIIKITKGRDSMGRDGYVRRLMDTGMLQCCAERTVDVFLEHDEYAGLERYISLKEGVAEVLG